MPASTDHFSPGHGRRKKEHLFVASTPCQEAALVRSHWWAGTRTLLQRSRGCSTLDSAGAGFGRERAALLAAQMACGKAKGSTQRGGKAECEIARSPARGATDLELFMGLRVGRAPRAERLRRLLRTPRPFSVSWRGALDRCRLRHRSPWRVRSCGRRFRREHADAGADVRRRNTRTSDAAR